MPRSLGSLSSEVTDTVSQKESFGGQSRRTEEEPVGYRLGNESRGWQAAGCGLQGARSKAYITPRSH